MPGKQVLNKNGKPANSVNDYFDALESPQKEVASRLRQLLKAHFPDLSEGFKGRVPVYALDENNLFSIEAYPNHVHFKFFKGALLLDPYYLLEGSGKGVRHLTFHTPQDINEDYVRQLIAQAIDREMVR